MGMPTNGVIRNIIEYLIQILGYVHVLMLKDLTVFITGIAIGVLIMTLLISRVFHRIRQVEDLGKVTTVKFKHEGKTHYFTHVDSFHESVEFVVMMILLPFTHNKEYTVSDKKRAKIYVCVVLFITLILIISSLAFVTHPLVKPSMIPPEWQ